ncbi:hypothetical protein SASPL_143518 [Salvia splendens]|uniref:Uncharacterized protein n=1 Tax=Salvia splendens TaxID=180675 RepID=A0A8X8WP11_SALSN|nr:hypothetical protein SASPL_143518 [Salvia splendens]
MAAALLVVVVPKIAPRNNESRDADRRSPLLANMLLRVPTPNDSRSDHVGSESRMEFTDSKHSIKEVKVESRNMKSESRDLPQTAKSDKHDGRCDDNKESKHGRGTYSEPKGNEKLDKDGCSGSSSQLNLKYVKEQHRLKQYPDVPGGNAETGNTSLGSLHGPTDAGNEVLHVDDKDFSEACEAVGENKVDTKVDDKLKDKDRKRKEHDNNINETKDMGKEERESERGGIEKKEPEKEKDNVKELLNGSEKEAPQNEKVPGKFSKQGNFSLELKKKDHDSGKMSQGNAQIGLDDCKTGVSCVVYKIGECMQELIKLWKEYESLQADKACDGAQNGLTLEICIPAEHVTATNRQEDNCRSRIITADKSAGEMWILSPHSFSPFIYYSGVKGYHQSAATTR